MVGPVIESPSLAQTVGLADWVGLPNPHSCHYCGTNPGFDFLLESQLSLIVRRAMVGTLLESPSMVQTVGGGLLVSPSLAQPRGRRPPRVAIAGSNPSSCHYRGTNPGFDFLLVSLTWFKPGERLSLANRWMCQYPYGKNTDVSRGTNPGGN